MNINGLHNTQTETCTPITSDFIMYKIIYVHESMYNINVNESEFIFNMCSKNEAIC